MARPDTPAELTTRASRERPLDLTIVFPAYNEAETLENCCAQIAETLTPTGLNYEFLLVNDGSSDGTWAIIKRMAEADPRVHGIRHRRNAGKACALANGFAYARGNVIAICDADMQYEPEDVLRIIDKVYEGYDAVSANKVVRRDPLERRLPSKFFNFFLRRTTGVQLHDMNAGLKAFRRDAARELIRYGYGELHRYFMVILALKGFSVAEVPVESLPRPAGRSKYGFERYLRGAMDFLTVFFLSDYLERPLHLFGGLGLLLAGGGTVAAVASIVLSLLLGVERGIGVSMQIATLLILSGVQMFVIGLVAEMINNLEHGPLHKTKIAEVLGVERRADDGFPLPQLERRAPRDAATLALCGVDPAEEHGRTTGLIASEN